MAEHFNDPERMRRVEKFVQGLYSFCYDTIGHCKRNPCPLSSTLSMLCTYLRMNCESYLRLVEQEDACCDGDDLEFIQEKIRERAESIKRDLQTAISLGERLDRGETEL